MVVVWCRFALQVLSTSRYFEWQADIEHRGGDSLDRKEDGRGGET